MPTMFNSITIKEMKSSTILTEKTKVKIAFLNVYILWGATYFAIVFAMKGFPPFVLSSIRFFIAGSLLLSWRLLKGEQVPSLKNIGVNGLSGILVIVTGTGIVSWAQQYISSSEAAILGATQPFFFILFDKKQWKSYFSNRLIIAGLAIGFLGLYLFLQQSSKTTNSSDNFEKLFAYLALIVSAACWVAGTLLSKNNGKKYNSTVFMNTGVQLLTASLVTSIISYLNGTWQTFHPTSVPLESWFSLLFLILGGSIISYLSFVSLISKRPAAIVGTFTYVNPVVAVVLGVLFLDEGMTLVQILSLLVILSGVLMTNISNYQLSRKQRIKLLKLKYTIRHMFFIPRYRLSTIVSKN